MLKLQPLDLYSIQLSCYAFLGAYLSGLTFTSDSKHYRPVQSPQEFDLHLPQQSAYLVHQLE